jgi:hypothetical protein
MKILLLIMTLSFGLLSQATLLTCDISLNSKKILSHSNINTQVNEKVAIGESQGIIAYVTEKVDSSFSVEAFLANEEARIYAEGPLKNSGEKVSASFWGRDSLVDVLCSKP